jgi:integrase
VAKHRRDKGSGSVYQRSDGRYVASLTDGTGHRRSFYARSLVEAEERLATARQRDRQGLKLTHGRQTFDAWLTKWLEAKRRQVRVSTWSAYRGHLTRYVIGKPIGSVQLVDLRAEDLASLYASLEGTLSPQTIRHLATVLRQALRAAVEGGEILRNPAEFVKPPRVTRPAMTTLTAKQAEALIRAASEDDLEALWVLAVTTGMRLGECLGLRWRSVDERRGALSVETSLTVNGQRATLTEPKSAASRRRVSLSEFAVDALRRRRADERDRVRTGERAVSSTPEFADLVFTNARGEPLDPRALVTKRFGPLLTKAGLPHVRFHDLRHTAATLLLASGEHPKVVSAMLGHSTIRTTLDLYSHVSDAMTRQAARTMDRLLGWEAEPEDDRER